MECSKRFVCMVFGSMVARCPYGSSNCPEVDSDGNWLDDEEEKDEEVSYGREVMSNN